MIFLTAYFDRITQEAHDEAFRAVLLTTGATRGLLTFARQSGSASFSGARSAASAAPSARRIAIIAAT